MIEDNKNFRAVNKGLSTVINEVIQCISQVMDNEKDQGLVLRILKILNTHHSELIQRTVHRTDSFLNYTTENSEASF